MANEKISAMPTASALTGSELVEVVQGGDNKKTTTQDIADLGGGGSVASVTGDGVDNTDPANPIIDLTTPRTVTSSSSLADRSTKQSDNVRIIYANDSTPFNIIVNLLLVNTEITVINIGSGTVTLIDGTSSISGGSIAIAAGENALIIYRVAATPDVYTGVAAGGTVTSVAALTLGTTGTDLSSSVANGTTTPVITLNVPTASAANRGALSSTDWSTFNNKQATGLSFLLASGGTASASNTRTFNTANWDNKTSTYTTTANNQYVSDETGTITHRATASDFTYGRKTSRTFVAAANNQRSVDLWIKPVFTNGAFTNVEIFAIHAETGTVVIGTTIGTIPTTQKMKIFGGTTGSEIGFEVVDSGNVPTLQVLNNGTVQVKAAGTIGWTNQGALIRSETLSSMSVSISGNHPTTGAIRFRAGATTHTAAGDYPVTTVEGVWTTASGSSRWIGNQQSFTINQTSTATGDVIGYHYKPTVTAIQGKNIAFLSESGQHLFNGTTVTASTTADVRGISSGTILRLANNSNTEKFKFLNTGSLVLEATNTAGGTTGNQTIDKISGTVNIAAAGTTVTVTNSLVTTASIVFAVVRTNDTTALIKNVVPGAGSFVVNMNAAVTAETSIGFFVIN